jgi:hypothetical protein
MSDPSKRVPLDAAELIRIARVVGIALVAGAGLSLFTMGGFDVDDFGRQLVLFAMVGVTIALQRRSMLIGIMVGIACAFGSVLLFEGYMASWAWIGHFFISALKMIIAPLILFAMVTGVAGLGDVRKLGRISRVTILYYLSTSVVAVVIGALVVNIIQPGSGPACWPRARATSCTRHLAPG